MDKLWPMYSGTKHTGAIDMFGCCGYITPFLEAGSATVLRSAFVDVQPDALTAGEGQARKTLAMGDSDTRRATLVEKGSMC